MLIALNYWSNTCRYPKQASILSQVLVYNCWVYDSNTTKIRRTELQCNTIIFTQMLCQNVKHRSLNQNYNLISNQYAIWIYNIIIYIHSVVSLGISTGMFQY